jgi:hypothetical protein
LPPRFVCVLSAIFLASLASASPLDVTAWPDPAFFTPSIWNADGSENFSPEYFSGLPEAYGVPTNYVDAPGSWIIPMTPTAPPNPIVDAFTAPSIIIDNPPCDPPVSEAPEPSVPGLVLVGLALIWLGYSVSRRPKL